MHEIARCNAPQETSPPMPKNVVIRFASAALISTTLVVAGCHKGPQDGVVATVNGHAIQRTEVDKIYDAQLANNPQQQVPSQDQADSLRLNILHQLVLEEIVDQRARQAEPDRNRCRSRRQSR